MKSTPNTPKVFIAGSRRLSRLNPSVRGRINNIMLFPEMSRSYHTVTCCVTSTNN
jgi:hypothetical protein